MAEQKRRVLSASSLIGDEIKNPQGEKLGKLEEIMIDLESGKIAYGVLSFGGFLGMGEKLFALPWNKLHVDQERECLVLNANKERLKDMPGFDKDHWPDMADLNWKTRISDYYENF
jgi:sporulation protein YlmC with PRC-barrel domain